MPTLLNHRPTRSGAALTISALLAASAWLGPAALAADPPVRGTPACATVVEDDPDVRAAVQVAATASLKLKQLPDADPGLRVARAAVNAAGRALVDARAAARLELCVASPPPTSSTTPPPTSSSPSTTGSTPPPTDSSSVEALLARIAALDCGPTFATDRGAITDAQIALSNSRVSQAEQGRVSDALNARESALGFCFGTPGADVEVDPTDDDGSEVDGSQVGIVPDGSVSTGGA